MDKAQHLSLHFAGLRSDDIEIRLIEESDAAWLDKKLSEVSESEYFRSELQKSCLPAFDELGNRTKYGFYISRNDDLAGLCLLGVSNWKDGRGYTGADTLPHMRGRGVAPGCKPMLFYLGFELLGLNRIETGCAVSNSSSRRSIEKVKGFTLEGTLREYSLNPQGEYEDELRYAILRRDWLKHYDRSAVEILRRP